MRGFRLWAAIGLALAVGGVFAWLSVIAWAPARADYAVQGIDVSDENGAIAWSTVKAMEVDFGYARATIGGDARDARFTDYWVGMEEAGVRRGAIHVFSLCAPALDQADNFVATVPRDPDALPVAIDLDFHADCPARPQHDVALGEIRRLAAILETHSGKPVILRISPAFESQYQVSAAIPRSMWSTGSFFRPTYLSRPWRMWRSNAMRRIEGVDHPVNWNVVAP